MDEKKRVITTRALPRLSMAPAPDPETRPKPLMSHTLKLREPGIPRESLPKAIDRSGEKKTIITTHDHLAPGKPAPKEADVAGPIVIAQGRIATLDKVFVGQAMKPAGKGKAKR